MADVPFHWDRIWFPAGSQVSLVDGYLPDPEEWMDQTPETQGVGLEGLADVPCLILLGVPGMGKTSEMKAAAALAVQHGELVDFVSLARLTGPTGLSSLLFGSAHHEAWLKGATVWNIFLDGLDEALAQLSQIEKAIPDLVRQLAHDTRQLKTLRLRISCRSAEWPQTLEAELRGLWPANQVHVMELGHLRERDVKLAVDQLFPTVGQQDQFMAYLQKYEAQPLASRPVTLNMLLNVFQQETALPKQQVQLYRKGLLAFIEEANETRRSNPQTWQLDPRSKLMVAARIAACTIFSNNVEIWTGHQSQVPPERATVLSEIAGGYEPTLGSSFPVGEAELRETLLTSLFVPHRAELFGWSHQTFAEFLAAYYLVEHRLTAEEALGFFHGASDSKGQIPPQLTEVAAWLASMQPEFFRALIRTEPAILLRSDVASASPEDREALVGGLLQRIDNEELHDFQHDFRPRYERLIHPRLGEQLRKYITDKTKNRVVRRVAIDIAEANNLTELAILLTDVTLDITDDVHIRSQAAHAVSDLGVSGAKSRLKQLIRSDQPEDVEDELKGYALQSLWPGQISIQELLAGLTPLKNNNFLGAYYFFLSELQLPKLSEDEAVSVLQWCADILRADHEHTAFDRIVPRFLARVFEASDSSIVRERFVDFLLGAVREGAYWAYGDLFRKSLSDSIIADDNEGLRRDLILSILRRAAVDKEREWSTLLGGPDPLIATHDLNWLVGLLTSESQSQIQLQLIELVVNQTFGRKLDDIFFVWEAAANSTELSDALENAYSVDLSSAVAKWQRDDLERKKRRTAEELKEPIETVALVERALATIEANGSFGWWRLNLILFSRPDGRLDPSSEFQADITKSRGWALLSETQRVRVVASAQRYLVENFVRSRQWIGTQTHHRPAAAGYRAFHLLLSEDEVRYLQLDKRVWRKWTTSIISVHFNDDDREMRQRIIRRCFDLATKQVLLVVNRLLSKATSEYDVRNLLRWFSSSHDDNLNSLLWNFLNQTPSDDLRLKPIIRFLVQENYAPAVELTINLFGSSASFSQQIFKEDGFIVAAAALIRRNAQSAWPYFLDLRTRDEKLAIQIINGVLDVSGREDTPFVSDLSEAQLSDLYVWLYRAVPPPIEQGGARYLGFDDQADRLRNVILNTLTGRGTAASLLAVQEIASKLPETTWLRWRVIDARREVAAKSWKRLDPAEVIATIWSYHPMPNVRSAKEAIKVASASLQNVIDMPLGDVPATLLETAPDTVPLSVVAPTTAATVKSRRILAVATEWSSGHGGLSTLNRELCTALAATGHSVVCLVVEPTQREIDEANAAKVRLIGCPADPVVRDSGRLLLFHPSQLTDFTPEIVIGHDHITGSAAQNIAHRHYKIPNVHFVHTLPEEIEIYKSSGGNSMLRGAEKAEVQYQQCLAAQLVVGVGPRIHREMSTKIAPNSDVPLVTMRPGLNKSLLKYDVDLTKPRRPHCLFLARLEDGELKGAGLACQVIFSLNTDWTWKLDARPRLVMRGFDQSPEKFAREVAAIGGFKEAIEYLIPRPYTGDAETIATDIRSASAIIMPSKREGFGLTALEGIAAGIPILVSSESGLAWLLLEHDIQAAIGASIADACVADVDGKGDDIKRSWASRTQAILFDPAKAFAEAKQMRAALIPLLSWERAAEKFSQDIETIM